MNSPRPKCWPFAGLSRGPKGPVARAKIKPPPGLGPTGAFGKDGARRGSISVSLQGPTDTKRGQQLAARRICEQPNANVYRRSSFARDPKPKPSGSFFESRFSAAASLAKTFKWDRYRRLSWAVERTHALHNRCLKYQLEVRASHSHSRDQSSRQTWTKLGRRGMVLVALEINFALWIMIGCAGMKAAQLVQYLS